MIINLRLLAAALIFSGCAPYVELAPNLRLRTGKLLANSCERSYGSQVSFVYDLVKEHAEKENIVNYWPPKKPINVCVVGLTAYVACMGRALAGCSFARIALVSTQWAPEKPHVRIRPDYDWRKTLAHEFIGALIRQDVLDLSHVEKEFIYSDEYKNILERVAAEL